MFDFTLEQGLSIVLFTKYEQNSRYKTAPKRRASRYCPSCVQYKGVHRFELVFLFYKKTYQSYYLKNQASNYLAVIIGAPIFGLQIYFKVPNRPVAVDAWERSACYPRGSFYPISYVHTTMQRRITLTCFRTCSTCKSRSQAGLSQYRFSTISIRTKPTFVHLRCHLGGDLPSQTAHQTMSFYRVFMR